MPRRKRNAETKARDARMAAYFSDWHARSSQALVARISSIGKKKEAT